MEQQPVGNQVRFFLFTKWLRLGELVCNWWFNCMAGHVPLASQFSHCLLWPPLLPSPHPELEEWVSGTPHP